MRAHRAAWIGLIVAAATCGCAAARAEGPAAVRVLVYEGSDPIAVGAKGSTREVRIARRRALRRRATGRGQLDAERLAVPGGLARARFAARSGFGLDRAGSRC